MQQKRGCAARGAAAAAVGLHFAGENALQRYDQDAYDQMLVYKENLVGLTYLRMTEELMKKDNLQRFRCFVFAMHGNPSDCTIPGERRLTEQSLSAEQLDVSV
eukprot:symbB.v1.2.010846.t1/scaffold702.1/size173641/4